MSDAHFNAELSSVTHGMKAYNLKRSLKRPADAVKPFERILVGDDFGAANSGVHFHTTVVPKRWNERRTKPTPILDVGDKQRLETFAAVWLVIDKDGKIFCQLVFGARAYDPPQSFGQDAVLVATFRNIKLALLYGTGNRNTADMDFNALQEYYDSHQKMLARVKEAQLGSSKPGCLLQDPLTGHPDLVDLSTINDVIVKFLWWKKRLTMHHFMRLKNISAPEVVINFFDKQANFAISVPTVSGWSNEAIDLLRSLAAKADYPRHTIFPSEALSEAIYQLFRCADQSRRNVCDLVRKETKIIGDWGGSTFDLTALRFQEAFRIQQDQQVKTFRLTEIIKGDGLILGSDRINYLFKQWIRSQLTDGLLSHVRDFVGDESDCYEALGRGLELHKFDFNGENGPFKVCPFTSKPFTFVPGSYGQLTFEVDWVVVPNGVILDIFNQCLWPTARKLEEFASRVKPIAEKEESTLKIGLCGLGPRPPYVLNFIRQYFSEIGPWCTQNPLSNGKSIEVELMDSTNSSVSHGNTLLLSNTNIDEVQRARASFQLVNYSFGQGGMRRTASDATQACAIVNKGDNISMAAIPTSWVLVYNNPVFPIYQEVFLQRQEDGNANWETVHTMRFQIDSAEAGKLNVDWLEYPGESGSVLFRSQLKLECVVTLRLEELVPVLELSIPMGGKIDKGNASQPMFMPLQHRITDMYAHLAKMDYAGEEDIEDDAVEDVDMITEDPDAIMSGVAMETEEEPEDEMYPGYDK